MIFKGVREGKPYPEHGLSYRQWAQIPPRQIRLDELVTTTTVLALDRLLSEDSTFYGDLFPHAVQVAGQSSTSKTACTARCGRRCATARCCTPGCSTWTVAPHLPIAVVDHCRSVAMASRRLRGRRSVQCSST